MNVSRLFITSVVVLLAALPLTAQESGVLWIKTFKEGSDDPNDATIDKSALATLDTLMSRDDVDVVFYGAADSLDWRLWGRSVSEELNSAWNDAKRLGRARALNQRYGGKAIVSITHENIRAVKVVWGPTFGDRVKSYLEHTQTERSVPEVENIIGNYLDRQPIKKDTVVVQYQDTTRLISDIGFKIGWWTWEGSGVNINAPNVALLLESSLDLEIVIRVGVSPFIDESVFGDTRESFLYIGGRHWMTSKVGIDAGFYRGWEFLTSTDNWIFRTTGFNVGAVYQINRSFELYGYGSYSGVEELGTNSHQGVSGIVGIDFNLR